MRTSWSPNATWLIISLSLATPALANDATPTDNHKATESSIERIIVTGTKLNQGVKEVPMSVSVFDSEAIRKHGMVTLRDIDDYAPNVSISQIGQVGGTYISIRGIESNPFIVNRTAVYVDGIPYREPDMLRLHDVSQIEILRGPQGTLYGSNADAGVIVITTKTPYQELDGELGWQLNSFENGQSHTLNGTLSGGISETLTAIANIEVEDADSYLRNIAAADGEQGAIRHLTTSTKFRYQPGDRAQLDLLLFYNKTEAPGLYEQEFPAIDRVLYNNTYGTAANGGRTIGRFEHANDAPKNTDEDEHGVALGLQYDLDDLTFHLTASYRREEEVAYGADFDLTAMPASAAGKAENNTNWYLETRLADDDREGIDWVIGATFSHDTKDRTLYSIIGQGQFANYAKAQVQSLTPTSQALFGQAVFPLTERFNLTAGLRYEHSETLLEQDKGLLDLGAVGQFTFAAVREESSNDEWVPKLALDYRWSDDTRLYASATKGFMPGGYNLVAAENGPEIARRYGPYSEEELWSYELGAKSDLFDGKAFISGALFFIDAKSWQEYNALTTPDGKILSTILVNSDAAIESRGFELELHATPTDGLTLTAGLGYIDAEYSQYQFSPTLNYAGNKVKMVPEFDVTFSGSYDISDNWYVRGDVQGIGRTPLNQENTVTRDTQWLLGLSSGYQTDNWSVRVYAKNLTNERYASGLAYQNFLFGNDGNAYAPIANPRTLGAEFSWHF